MLVVSPDNCHDRNTQYEAKGGNWTPFSGAFPHYVLLNVAVGNNWVGKVPASTPFPQTMSVDWIKASRIS
ncbi:MAG: hypothetical protein ABIY38_12930 [Rhodococcus sp. (in: high G+C Gram-positive bacteria)]